MKDSGSRVEYLWDGTIVVRPGGTDTVSWWISYNPSFGWRIMEAYDIKPRHFSADEFWIQECRP
jgi:hypothetical protein